MTGLCSLVIANEGPFTLEQIAEHEGTLTGERIRQVERSAFKKFRRRMLPLVT